jgi:hypothetical protein
MRYDATRDLMSGGFFSMLVSRAEFFDFMTLSSNPPTCTIHSSAFRPCPKHYTPHHTSMPYLSRHLFPVLSLLTACSSLSPQTHSTHAHPVHVVKLTQAYVQMLSASFDASTRTKLHIYLHLHTYTHLLCEISTDNFARPSG